MSDRCVLVVEDDQVFAWVLAEALRHHGWQIQQAADAATALELLRSGSVTHLVCDVHLPDHSGLAVLQVARRTADLRRIVAISGLPDADFYLRVARRAGADALLGKPFSHEELLRCLEAS